MNDNFSALCKFENCKNKTFIVTIDNNYSNKLLSKYLDLTKKENTNILTKLSTSIINLKHFLVCKKHLIEIYKPFFQLINPKITNEEFIKYFEIKINQWHCNKIYSSLFSSSDNLRKSLINISNSLIDTPINFEDINVYIPDSKNILNSELRWFNEENHYAGIPVYWKKNYSLKEYIGTTKEQGKLNGPDFIFNDNFLNKTVGFEIFELNPNLFIFKKPLKNPETFSEKIENQINKEKGGNLSRNILNLLEQVNKKAKKWEKYKKTDIKSIGVIINNSVPDEWYIVMEYLINYSNEKPKDIDWVFLL